MEGVWVFQLSGIMTQGAAGWCVFVTIHFGKQPTPTCSLGNLYRTLKHFSSLFLRVRISDRARLLRCSIILGAQKYRAYQTIPSSYSVSKKKNQLFILALIKLKVTHYHRGNHWHACLPAVLINCCKICVS